MLVFAVLTDPSGMTYDTGGIVVVHKPEHQLPLYKFRFEYNTAAAPAVGASSYLYKQGAAVLRAAARSRSVAGAASSAAMGAVQRGFSGALAGAGASASTSAPAKVCPQCQSIVGCNFPHCRASRKRKTRA